jgi:hypothetical protein
VQEYDESVYKVRKILEHPNYFRVEENIHVIKDFTTQDERDWFISIAESAPEENWWKDQRIWWNGKILYIGDENTGNKNVSNILSRISELFDEESNFSLGGMITVHRMKPGEAMFLHSDNPSGSDGTTNYVIFGMGLYHSDFRGGEVHYENLGISYKPEKGDLIMHPGSLKYTHRTLPVLPGPIRYLSTTFAFDPEVKRLREQKMVFENMDTGIAEGEQDPITKYHR